MSTTMPTSVDSCEAYRTWRAEKLADYPADIERLRVYVNHLADPSAAELAAIGEHVAKCNMALVDCGDPAQVQARALLQLGRRIGLLRPDGHLRAGVDAVSAIRVEPDCQGGEYIPYTNRPLNWHTDGYYNPPQRAVRAWMLFCAQDAIDGGENALLDPEIAYLRLRDEDPELVAALMEPNALTIPANTEAGAILREASVGPVFSWLNGSLHMRYTARTRHAVWSSKAATQAAREALTRLFSSDDSFIYRHKLKPGEGYITNNVLHNRSGFTIASPPSVGRTLLRVRYRDRIAIESTAPAQSSE